VLESTSCIYNHHVASYALTPTDRYCVLPYTFLEFKWRLSIYSYEGEAVVMNCHSQCCEYWFLYYVFIRKLSWYIHKMPWYKVWSVNRDVTKSVKAESLEELKQKGMCWNWYLCIKHFSCKSKKWTTKFGGEPTLHDIGRVCLSHSLE